MWNATKFPSSIVVVGVTVYLWKFSLFIYAFSTRSLPLRHFFLGYDSALMCIINRKIDSLKWYYQKNVHTKIFVHISHSLQHKSSGRWYSHLNLMLIITHTLFQLYTNFHCPEFESTQTITKFTVSFLFFGKKRNINPFTSTLTFFSTYWTRISSVRTDQQHRITNKKHEILANFCF